MNETYGGGRGVLIGVEIMRFSREWRVNKLCMNINEGEKRSYCECSIEEEKR